MQHEPRLRILHVVPTYLPAVRYGGPIVAVHGLCSALAAAGHSVEVFTTNVDGPGTSAVPIGEPVEIDGVRVHYFRSQLARLYWSREMARELARRAREFDVIHIHAVYLWPGVAAARHARRARIPYVISPRGMLVPQLIRRKSRFVKLLWLKVMEHRGFASAAAIHFTSQLEWDDARQVGLPLPHPFVVPNGIAVHTRPDVARDDDMLLFLGRLNWKKGLDRVIEALPRIAGMRLVIAGNDEENLTPRLQELAQREGVAGRVEFPGPVYGGAKDELLARATLFVLASTSENFGNAVLEALAMETPVVLSREVGLAGDVAAADAGVIASKDELADQVEALRSDPLRRARMGANGRKLVETRFTWERIADAMAAQYRSMRKGPR